MSHARRVRSALLIVVLCALASVPVFAQMETATLSGAITDPKGGVVPDAEVTANSQYGQSTRCPSPHRNV